MKEWRKQFSEAVQKYKWQINYEYDSKKGKYKGKGQNGKPHEIGVFENKAFPIPKNPLSLMT